jgi:hypothetical protein
MVVAGSSPRAHGTRRARISIASAAWIRSVLGDVGDPREIGLIVESKKRP